MSDSFSICTSSMPKFLRKFIQKLRALSSFKKWKRRKPTNRLLVSSSFAAMEVSNQLKQVFEFIDVNGDGKISPSELSQVLFGLGHERSTATKEAHGMVKEMDINGDGFVDLDEFMTAVMMDTDNNNNNPGVEDFGSNGGSSSSSSAKEKEDDLIMEAFLVFDADKNGLISAAELQSVLVGLGCPKNCSLRDCRRMIRGVDKDGDGFVDFDEFKAMMIVNSSSGCLSC